MRKPIARDAKRTEALESKDAARPAVRRERQPGGIAGVLTALQRTHGNLLVQRLLASRLVQAKLTVGPPNDRYEQEADRVADRVMSMDASSSRAAGVQRELIEEEEDLQTKAAGVQRELIEEEEDLQTKSAAQGHHGSPAHQARADGSFDAGREIERRLNARRGGGEPLPDETRVFMETRFGADFGAVRVHADAEAAQLTRSVDAHAFTHGADVYFSAGKYTPNTQEGKRLLAHELTHMLQQRSGRSDHHSSDQRVMHRPGVGQVQRYFFDAPKWAKTDKVTLSAEGQTGVAFFDDGSPHQLVVKPASDDISETFAALALHQEIAQVGTTQTRVADDPTERVAIVQALYEKGDWEQAADDLGASDISQVQVDSVNRYTNAIYLYVMDRGPGKPFKNLATRRTEAEEVLKDSRYIQKLGELTAIDIFLGNHDRLVQRNLGNWLVKVSPGDAPLITVIDNVGPQGWAGRDVSKDLEMLAPSKLAETTGQCLEQLVLGLAKEAALTRKFRSKEAKSEETLWKRWWDQPRFAFAAEAFEQGLRTGRERIIAQLAPRKGARSRSLKAESTKYGKSTWKTIKTWADQLRELTEKDKGKGKKKQ